MTFKPKPILLIAAVISTVGFGACLGDGGPKPRHSSALRAASSGLQPAPCGTYSGRGCASRRQRVDLRRPSFSQRSTKITNPLFPISRLRSVVLLGHVSGKPFRTETPLLPGTKTVNWEGQQIRVLVSQYVA